MNRKHLDKSSWVIVWLLIVSVVNESLAVASYYAHFNKFISYHICCVLDFFLMLVYFIRVSGVEKQNRLILFAGTITPALGLINMLFQPITEINTYMQICESFFVTLAALYALYKILVDDSIQKVVAYQHFWFSTAFLILYGGTFFFWAFILTLAKDKHSQDIAQSIQIVINIVAYAVIGITMLRYPKMQKHG